jgi:hypothetical protein
MPVKLNRVEEALGISREKEEGFADKWKGEFELEEDSTSLIKQLRESSYGKFKD